MEVEMLISDLGLGLPLRRYCCPCYCVLCVGDSMSKAEEQVVALLLVLIPTVLLPVLR
jgi:hypothetical protein